MIIIQGIPGCGKTTITTELGARERLPVFLESIVENPYLSKYYANPGSYAFPMQIMFLNNNYRHILKAQSLPQCVIDTGIYTNDLFIELQHMYKYISEDDYSTYCSLSATIKSTLKPPDLMVYLKCSPQTAINRIINRGRPSELKASISYWYDLHDINNKFYENYEDSKKISIDVDELNVVRDESDLDYILDCIMDQVYSSCGVSPSVIAP